MTDAQAGTLTWGRARTRKRGKSFDLLPALLFLLPNLLGFLAFTAGPVVYSLAVSFTDQSLLTPEWHWIGLRNYADIAADSVFWTYLVNTVYFFLAMPVSIAASLFLAVLLHQKLRGMIVYRTVLYLPSFTAGVALMIMWKQLLNPDYGAINSGLKAVLDLLNLAWPLPQWLNSTHNMIALNPERVAFDAAQIGLGARDALMLMGVWTGVGGGSTLLYLAALGNVPDELHEAAALDGAAAWRRFWSITWPHLGPTTFFVVIMGFIGGFQGGFDSARVMTQGGPAGTTTTIAYHIYQKAFEQYQVGYASAVSWVLFAIVFIVTMINWKFGKWEQTTG
jgi:multiple sugar transport system permease protein